MAITLTAGDTASVITAALTVGGSAYDLTSKTVQAKIRPRNGATILVSCSNVGDPTTGTVSLSLPSNLGAGVYDVVFVATQAGGAVLTFPNTGALSMNIVAALV